jgi:hypothetical protein
VDGDYTEGSTPSYDGYEIASIAINSEFRKYFDDIKKAKENWFAIVTILNDL